MAVSLQIVYGVRFSMWILFKWWQSFEFLNNFVYSACVDVSEALTASILSVTEFYWGSLSCQCITNNLSL